MKVPGQRFTTLALIIVSGLTTVSASEARASNLIVVKHVVASVNQVPSFVDTPTVGRSTGTETRASRDAARGFVARPPTVKDNTADCTSCHSYGTPAKSRVDIVLSFAMAQRGKPYIFGASGPDAYDCSGLVMKAYEQVGIYLPHYTGTMLHYGHPVSQSQMTPGDIVFPSSSHVGIYIGNGKMIVAPHSGSVVQVQNVYAFYTARRIF